MGSTNSPKPELTYMGMKVVLDPDMPPNSFKIVQGPTVHVDEVWWSKLLRWSEAPKGWTLP